MTLKKKIVAAVVALVLIGAVALIVILTRTMFFPSVAKPQPPGLPSAVEPQIPTSGPGAAPTIVAPAAPSPVKPGGTLTDEAERQAQDALMRQAMTFASRSASYSSVDGFATILEVFPQSTPDVQTYLLNLQKSLQAAHPIAGPSWGQNTRSLAPMIASGIPILTSGGAQVTVQTRQTTETDGKETSSYKEADITFVKINGAWLVSRVEWKDIAQP